jgi:clathrin heavy chain
MHELLEFRRIAAFLYRRNKKYQAALNLSMEDKMYRDCIDTA